MLRQDPKPKPIKKITDESAQQAAPQEEGSGGALPGDIPPEALQQRYHN